MGTHSELLKKTFNRINLLITRYNFLEMLPHYIVNEIYRYSGSEGFSELQF